MLAVMIMQNQVILWEFESWPTRWQANILSLDYGFIA